MARKEFARGSCGRSEAVVSGDGQTGGEEGKKSFSFWDVASTERSLRIGRGVGPARRPWWGPRCCPCARFFWSGAGGRPRPWFRLAQVAQKF